MFMAILRYIVYHRGERLCMYISIMPVDKVDSLMSAQVVESLFHCQSVLAAKFQNEDHRPFQLVRYIIFHLPFLFNFFLAKVIKLL